MAKRVSSRLAKKKKKELTKQSLVLLLLSILLGSIFIFFILPSAVRLFFEILDEETNVNQVSTIPPQPPILASPPKHTKKSEIELDGYGKAGAKLHLVVNNQKQDEVEINEEGQFTVVAKLQEGENRVLLYSSDEAGNESTDKIYLINKDTKPPQIKIGFPEDGASFNLKEDQTITIRGETEPDAQVYINDVLTYANSQGQFNHRFALKQGENKIEIKVEDQAGNQSQHELTVKYRD